MNRTLTTFFALTVAAGIVGAQVPTSFNLSKTEFSPLPRSNVINDLLISRDTVWVGAGRGISFTTDRGTSWKNFANTQSFEERGIAALALRGDEVWVSTAFTSKHENESIQTGGGLHYSLNRGETWSYVEQPVDTGSVDTLLYGNNRIPTLAVTVPEQNVTFDIALTSNKVWIASWAGILRSSTDKGKSWSRVILPPDQLNAISPTDTLRFEVSGVLRILNGRDTLRPSLNHVAFAVLAPDDSTLWVGTAGGINKSTDGGISWRKFNHQNQDEPISGNFVRAIAHQRWNGKSFIWAVTVNALGTTEKRGVSFTEDGGATWKTSLLGESLFNFAFRDSIVYVAGEGGLFRSPDFGQNWKRSGTINDPTTLQRFGFPRMYSVGVQGDTVWVGTSEGLAYTIDSPSQPFGTSWRIFRTHEPVGAAATTYSYPLPFSPDDEVVRIHYSTQGKNVPVSIRVFDFGMQPVRTLIQGAQRSGSIEHDEIWNGRDDAGRFVSNGVYFYRVEFEGNELWGKIMVLQ